MRKALTLLLLFAVIGFSCKKNNEPATAVTENYQPVTKGSYWKYKMALSQPTIYTVTMTGETELINGRLYYKYNTAINGQASTGSGAFYSENGIVMSKGNDNIFLKENAALTETWPYGDGTFMKVLEKGISHSVEGKIFNNVIHLKHIKQVSAGTTTDLNDYYIAKGIGMIEQRSADNTSVSLLTEYVIK